jgi:hypothetical protein
VGIPGTASPLANNADFLFLVNGQDDNANGWIDDGWDGVDNNLYQELNSTPVLPQRTDDLLEWENETWLGSLRTTALTGATYTIRRRPAPVTNAREISLPSDVVIDASSWGLSNERTRVPAGAFNIFSGTIDILMNPDGSVVPTTIYSSPSSVGLLGAFYHFWLAERSDVYGPNLNATGVATPIATPPPFYLPMPLTAISQSGTGTPTPDAYAALVSATPSLPYLKGEMRIVTLFTRTGQISTNDNPTFNVLNPNQPFLEAQLGVSGGQQ